MYEARMGITLFDVLLGSLSANAYVYHYDVEITKECCTNDSEQYFHVWKCSLDCFEKFLKKCRIKDRTLNVHSTTVNCF